MTRRRRRQRQTASAESGSLNRSSVAGLILLGLLIGLAGALYYAWVIAPIPPMGVPHAPFFPFTSPKT